MSVTARLSEPRWQGPSELVCSVSQQQVWQSIRSGRRTSRDCGIGPLPGLPRRGASERSSKSRSPSIRVFRLARPQEPAERSSRKSGSPSIRRRVVWPAGPQGPAERRRSRSGT